MRLGSEGCQVVRGRQRERKQRASAGVRLAQVRIPLSRDVTCQPVALKIAVPVENVAGRGVGLETPPGALGSCGSEPGKEPL